MTVVRVQQPHTVSHMQRQVLDALQIVGERAIALVMWNSQNADDDTPRCEHCYDEVTGGTDTTGGICPYCFGTTYAHGIKEAVFTSAVFSAIGGDSKYDKSLGEFDLQTSRVQVGPYIDIHDKDYVLKIDGWDITEKGAAPRFQEIWQVQQSFNSAYFKDGFSPTGDSSIIGTNLPVGRTDQSNPIARIRFVFGDTKVVSDNQPFVLYPESVLSETGENRPTEIEPLQTTLFVSDEPVPCLKAME